MKIIRSVHIVLVFFLCTLVACNVPTQPTSTQQESVAPVLQPDAVFDLFESIADTLPRKYVHDPDSFFNSLHLYPQTFEQQEMYAYGLIFMGYGLREYGDHYNSIRYYEKALNFIQEVQLKDIETNTYIIKPLAALYTLIDDNQKAINLLEQALQHIPADQYIERAGFSINLANAYLYNLDIPKAKTLLLEILKEPTNSLVQALIYNTLSSVYQEEKDTTNSIQYNALALKAFEQNELRGDTLVWYASALGLYGEIHQDLQHTQQALHIVETQFPNTQYRTKAKIRRIKGDILSNTKKIDLAKQEYRHIIEDMSTKVGDEYTRDYTYTQALFNLAKCYGMQNNVDSALYYYQWAIENDFRTQQLITSKQNQIDNNIWNRSIEEMSGIAETLLQQDIPDQDLIETLLWCIELSKGRLLINEINRSENWDKADPETKNAIQSIRNLYQKISQSTDEKQRRAFQKQVDQLMIDFQLSERYFETYNYSPQKALFLKHLSDSTKTFYSYYVHKDSTITVIGRLDNRYVYHKITDNALMTDVQHFKNTYFGASPHAYNSSPEVYYNQARKILHELLPDINKAKKNIHVSLDGPLYGIPFDALYDKDFLVNEHNFAYLNSFILYDLLKTTRTDQAKVALMYRSEFPSPLPDLSFVNEEVNKISKNFKSDKIGPDLQTDSNIVQHFANTNIIHIASHTILDKDKNPILYLQEPISTEQLRFYHIYSPLVFLSACNTGSGQSLPSEGMESIQRVFLSKGVPSVISTYWFANDEAMLQLTSSFYEQLYKSNHPAEALADAKRIFLTQASTEHQNPWYWANINYAGIENEIGLRKTSNLFDYIWIGVFALLTICLFYTRYAVKKDKKTNDKTY